MKINNNLWMSLSRLTFLKTCFSSAECSFPLALFCGPTKSSEVTESVMDLSEMGEEGGGVLLFAGGVVVSVLSGGNPLEGGGGSGGGPV